MSMRLPPWWLDVEPIGETTVVRFVNGALLNEESGYALANYVRSLVEEGNCRRIVINLARIDFLDSMLIGKLFGLHRSTKAAGGCLALCGINARLDPLLEMVKLPQLIPIGDTEEDALRVLNSMPTSPPTSTTSSLNGGTLPHDFQKADQKWREEQAASVPAVRRSLKQSPSPA